MSLASCSTSYYSFGMSLASCLYELFLKKSKMSQNFEKSFLGLFYVCFACKWCAALSSAVSTGGPEGQVSKFNANVCFKNIPVPYVNDIERNVENEYLQQVLQYLKPRIHASTDPKCWIVAFKLWGFCVNMWSKMPIFWKNPKCPKTFKNHS